MRFLYCTTYLLWHEAKLPSKKNAWGEITKGAADREVPDLRPNIACPYENPHLEYLRRWRGDGVRSFRPQEPTYEWAAETTMLMA